MRAASVGLPRLGCRAGARHGEVRRQHVVRRGAAREWACTGARRGHRHASARRRRCSTTCRSSCTSCSRICTWIICKGSASSGPCSCRAPTSTSGARARRSQHLADRIAMYLSPPLFPVRLDDVPSHLTFHDAPEEAVHDRLRNRSGRRRSRTKVRPSGTASRRTGACSSTFPITSRRWVATWSGCRPNG